MEHYGRRLLPTILHERGEREPDRVFASIARTDKAELSFQAVTYQQASRATHRVAQWLQQRFPHATRHETIAYIGVPDLRYNIFYYAALQCQFTAFVPTPRNPTATNTSLLEQTACSKVIFATELRTAAQALQNAVPGLEIAEFPSLETLLTSPPCAIPYRVRFEDVCHDPAFILQSSGSTGPPKPITMTNMAAASTDVPDWPTVEGRTNHDIFATLYTTDPNNYMVDFFPPWHMAGYFTKVMCPLITETIPIYGPPLRPPSGALAAEIIRMHQPRLVFLPPSIAEQLVYEPGGLELFENVETLLFGGGPLSDAVGSELAKRVKMCQFYGSTEVGQIHQLLPLPEDWAYMEFHPAEPFEMQPQGDGLFELVRFSGKEHEQTQWLHSTFPNIREWHTRDLFSPHPTKPGLWKFATRIDDILVLSSGEKLNPLPMEMALTAEPGVRGALVVGQGHPRTGLLLELDDSHPYGADPVSTLWPSIDKGNALLPTYGRVAKSMITYAHPQTPFVRAGKGTVIRRQTERLYDSEIQALYEDHASKRSNHVTNGFTHGTTLPQVKDLVRAVLLENGVPQDISDDENIYMYGMDSIRTVEAVANLQRYLEHNRPKATLTWVTGELFYRNPTVADLSTIIFDFMKNNVVPRPKDRVQEMKALIDQTVRRLPHFESPPLLGDKKLTIAITGTTGFLGGRLIRRMMDDPKIARIYCLNRSSTAAANFESRYDMKLGDHVQFRTVKLAKPMLGLSQKDYDELIDTCDVIIHNAWGVDFNRPLPSFEDNLKSTETLIGLSAASQRHPRIIFVSSISTTGVWSTPGTARQIVPATIIEDLSNTLDLGYAESKQVSEHVLDAAFTAGLPAAIVRMGQICPPIALGDRPWPKDDSMAVYLKTCQSLGAVANDLVDIVNWVPLDAAADVVCDVALHQHTAGPTIPVYNVVNPTKTAWSGLVPTVKTWSGGEVQDISMPEWIEKIQNIKQHDAKALKNLPALRTMAIFELMAKRGPLHDYDLTNTIEVSPALAKMAPINPALFERWLQGI